MKIKFNGKIRFWRGPVPWFFVTVPDRQNRDLKAILSMVTYGWGMIPVVAQIGKTKWKTSMFPKDGNYIVPIKTVVRKAEDLEEGDEITLQIQVE